MKAKTHLDTRLYKQPNRDMIEEERYRLLVESIQDYAIFLLDDEGRIISWNKGAAKIKGYKTEEIIGKHFSIFYPEEDIESKKPERELEIAKKFGRVEDEDWRVRKDGSQFWANVVITSLFDKTTGELLGFAKVTRDLTERKRQEDELHQANGILKEQQKELEILNNSKDEFISLVSHQLRTPATSIKQYLGMLLEDFAGETSQQQREYIKKAFDSNERQLSMVKNLLQIAQMDAGHITLRKIPTDMHELICNVIDENRENFARRHQRVTVDVPQKLRPVCVDPVHFRMALDNLIDNSSKYTGTHGCIYISARPAKSNLKISVKDNGVGIEEHNFSRLFEKFFRIPSKESGSGLGLYWAGKVVDLHFGKIEVESKVNQGTTFNVYVPMKGAMSAKNTIS